jgi:hypothetical protein
MSTLTEAELDELARLELQASKGMWLQHFDKGHVTEWVRDEKNVVCEALDGPHDAAFIAAIRNAAPALIEAARELRRINALDKDRLSAVIADQSKITEEQTAGLRAEVQRLTAERDAERLRCAKIAATNHCDSPTCCNAACDTGRAIEAKIRSGE